MRYALLVTLGLLGGCYLSHEPQGDGGSIGDGGTLDAGVDRNGPDRPEVGTDSGVPMDASGPECVLTPEECAAAVSLSGLRWELPCGGDTEWDEVCQTITGTRAVSNFAPGRAGQSFRLRLHFRGVVETKAYPGGVGDGYFREGGTPDSTNWNLYSLRTSSPEKTYYLNHGPSEPFYCVGIDYEADIPINGASTVELVSQVFDGRQIRNRSEEGDLIFVSDIAPSPGAFDGQFIQMDVLSIQAN